MPQFGLEVVRSGRRWPLDSPAFKVPWIDRAPGEDSRLPTAMLVSCRELIRHLE
jgi:hypothetical protein